VPNLKKYHLLLIGLLGGAILSLAWPVDGFPGLLFIGFMPFLFIEDYIHRDRSRFSRFSVFFYVYPGFLLWNVFTTWWIWNSTDFGAILAWVLNSLFMSAVMAIYHLTRRKLMAGQGFLMLAFYWIAFEYFHHNWDATWPWLSLGNGFASYYKWIQWYEYTGIFGGTLWIILVNILLYIAVKNYFFAQLGIKRMSGPLIAAIILIAVPIIISSAIYRNYTEKKWPVDIVIVQPNIDPYNEQYSLPPAEILDINLTLASQKMDSLTDFIVSPESAIQERIWERRLEQSRSLATIKKFLSTHPRAGYVIGASTYNEFLDDEPVSPTARKFQDGPGYYDAFNTALYIDSQGDIEIHHKSKLTPGVEKMPFSRLMKPLENFAINLGGTVGSLGTDPERDDFVRKTDNLKIAPAICYESVFGEYLAEYIRNGANLIFLITNDGWWGNTPGHRQHFTFSRLRAIETRRSIARSANTGISAFINQRGDAFQMTRWWEPIAIRQTINANDKMTFYVKNGDYIARIASFVSLFLLLMAIYQGVVHKKKKIHA
jgi:apolipoprotein N-acyltransferase